MKVRMKVEIRGTRDGELWPPVGGELTVSDREGAELCAQGYAEPVTAKAEPEKRPAAKKAQTR